MIILHFQIFIYFAWVSNQSQFLISEILGWGQKGRF